MPMDFPTLSTWPRTFAIPSKGTSKQTATGAPERRAKCSVQIQWWVTRRKRVGNKRGDFFAGDGPFKIFP